MILLLSACSSEDFATAITENIDSDAKTTPYNNTIAIITGTDNGKLVKNVDPDGNNLLEVSGKLYVIDNDADEAAFTEATVSGNYGGLSIDKTGNWNYAADNSQPVIQNLANDDSLIDDLTVSSVDGTTHQVVITIIGAEETNTPPPTYNPAVITGVDTGSVTEDDDPDNDNLLEVSGKLNITDSDAGEAAFNIITVTGNYGYLTIDSTGNWNYAADNNHTLIQNLVSGAMLTDSLTVSSIDGSTHQVIISIIGADETTPPPVTNDPAVITGVDTGSVTEDVDPDGDNLLEISGKLNITDTDAGEAAFIARTVRGNYGNLTIDTAGNWSYAADNSQAVIQNLVSGTTLTDSLTVSSIDDTTHAVAITIIGADEILASVSLSWVAPAAREDTTALSLSDIAGYKIYYGTTQGQYSSSVTISDSTAVGHTFTNFSSGTYYFVMTTIDTDGRESTYSAEVVKVI